MDSIILTAPGGGTSIQIGSWLDLPNGGADYGTKGLIEAQFVDNPFSEGALAFENVGVRHMAIPLLINARGVASLTQVESMLRTFARPGGYIDLAVEGIPTAEAVRFDLLTGRWEPAYDTYLQRVDRRRGTLYLDTGPYGYWPTWITLASVASMSSPGTLQIPGGSLIGDGPGLVEIRAVPTISNATTTWTCDGALWSLNCRSASFLPALVAGSWIGGAGTVNISGLPNSAGTGQVLLVGSVNASTLYQQLSYTIPSALEPAYRGQYRAFGVFQSMGGGSQAFMLDAAQGNATAEALASSGVVASGLTPSGYAFSDLGLIDIPRVGSGIQQSVVLRLWAQGSPTFVFGGLYLQPQDGDTGVVQAGLAFPSVGVSGSYVSAGFVVGGDKDSLSSGRAYSFRADVPSAPLRDLRRWTIGPMPRTSPSTSRLDLFSFQRHVGDPTMTPLAAFTTTSYSAPVSVRYRPRFQFVKGL